MKKTKQRETALWLINYEIKNIEKAKDEYWKTRHFEKATGVITAYQFVGIISEQESADYSNIALNTLYPENKTQQKTA